MINFTCLGRRVLHRKIRGMPGCVTSLSIIPRGDQEFLRSFSCGLATLAFYLGPLAPSGSGLEKYSTFLWIRLRLSREDGKGAYSCLLHLKRVPFTTLSLRHSLRRSRDMDAAWFKKFNRDALFTPSLRFTPAYCMDK